MTGAVRSLEASDPDVAAYALRLGDDALVLAQQLCGWAARAPEIEQDVALLNLALDLLGQARSLLSLSGRLDGTARDEDALAYLRHEREFTCTQLVEVDNGDFGQTMARQLVFTAYALPLWRTLCGSSDPDLAAIAGKAVKETAYHLDHARTWVVRLGDGTPESARRMQAGLDAVWPFAADLFAPDPLLDRLVRAGVAADPAALEQQWRGTVEQVLAEATLTVPATTWRPTGGRTGQHLSSFGLLLAELQSLHRAHPGARW